MEFPLIFLSLLNIQWYDALIWYYYSAALASFFLAILAVLFAKVN